MQRSWEAAHGPIPPGHRIAFKGGKPVTDEALIVPEALECITPPRPCAATADNNPPAAVGPDPAARRTQPQDQPPAAPGRARRRTDTHMTTNPHTTTIEDLRRRLFDAIDKLGRGDMTIDQAKLTSDLAQVIVNSAKVEVEYLRVTGGGESTFIEPTDDTNPAALPNGISGIVRHRLGLDAERLRYAAARTTAAVTHRTAEGRPHDQRCSASLDRSEKMLALSIRQPWASLILEGWQEHREPRLAHKYLRAHPDPRSQGHDPRRARGRHQFRGGSDQGRPAQRGRRAQDDAARPWLPSRDLPRGGIVGSVEIVACVTDSTSPWFVGMAAASCCATRSRCRSRRGRASSASSTCPSRHSANLWLAGRVKPNV